MTDAELAALLAGPPTGAATTGPKNLGVPEGYIADGGRAPVPFTTGRFGPSTYHRPDVVPRYHVGDEWDPAALSAEDRARLQRAMVDAGVIAKGTKFRLGIWDEATRNAYADLLAFANGAGLDWRAAMAQYARMKDYGDDDLAERQPLTVRLTNPEDLRASFETVARRRIGRKLSPEETDRFVRAYQAEEASVQHNAYDTDETGGTITDAPDPQAFLAARLAKEYGVEAEAKAMADYGNEFFELLRETQAKGI